MAEESFLDVEGEVVDKYKSSPEHDAVSILDNDSHEIYRMSEILRNFYDNLGSQTNWVLIAMYMPIIPIAIIANVLVIVVVFKNRYMRSTANLFVVNLSLADLLVTTICMPIAISQAVSITWFYGEIMCKLFFYLQGVAVAASVFTIMVMSIDRYFAIKNPIAFRRVFNRKNTIILIAAIWLASLSIFGPVLKAVTLHNLDQQNITLGISGNGDFKTVEIFKPPPICICSEDFTPLGIQAFIFGIVYFILIYAIPGTVVVIAYLMMGRTLYTRKPPFDCGSVKGSASSQQGFRLVRERKRVAWILLILAILFAMCWLPYNVLKLLVDLRVITESEWTADVLAYCLFLGHVNSMLNPVVYCFMTRNFRRNIIEILCHGRCDMAIPKPQRNTLAVAAWANRGIQDQICLSQGVLLGDTQRTSSGRRARLKRSLTTSTICEKSNSRISVGNRRCCRSISQTTNNHHLNPMFKDEIHKEVGCTVNGVMNVKNVYRVKAHSLSLQNIAIADNDRDPTTE